MKFINAMVVITLLFLSLSPMAGTSDQPRVLMVVSSYGEEQGEKLPGFEFDELAKAYLVFKANGLKIDIASPKGGAVEADKYNPEKHYNQQFLSDSVATDALKNTLSTKTIKPEDYAAVFVVGGKGAMFDLPKDNALQRVIASIYENDGTVSAVCHGPAALVDVKLSDGSFLVNGKAINSFTNAEEKTFGKKWMPHFDFMLEDKLKERGAKFEHAPMMLTHVANDRRVITGQNPFSTTATAEAVVRSLGITPVPLAPHKDEATIQLISRMLNQDPAAGKELAEQTEKYQPELVAMYGYYRMMFAESNDELQSAVHLMEVGRNYMDNPQLTLALAQGYQKLGQSDRARQSLTTLIKQHPDMDAAKQLLAQLDQKETKD